MVFETWLVLGILSIMPNQPLQPFPPPSALFPHFSGTLPPGLVAEWVFFIVLLFWALYTLVAIYHWLKYSHASAIAVPAIIVHLGVSFILISFALSGTLFI